VSRENLWGVFDRRTGKLALWDGRLPIYWRRRVATDAAYNHGLTVHGNDSDVVIRKVRVAAIPRPRVEGEP